MALHFIFQSKLELLPVKQDKIVFTASNSKGFVHTLGLSVSFTENGLLDVQSTKMLVDLRSP